IEQALELQRLHLIARHDLDRVERRRIGDQVEHATERSSPNSSAASNRDRRVPLCSARRAMRICSLLPSATEIVADLGLVESLVGISEECDWPPEVRGLPVVTASRIDTRRLSSLQIDRAVREAIGEGHPLYAI